VFVQATKSTRGKKTYYTYLVRESFRTEKGPRSRTICNITELPENIRELITAALKGSSCLVADNFQLISALDYGGLAVLHEAWDRFELDQILEPVASSRQRGLIKAMVFSRLLFPCAKMALAQRAQGSLLAQACGLSCDEEFDEDDLYLAMDKLNGNWVGVEKKLFGKAFPEGVNLVLYDLTSVYFEGKGPKHISKYGHSRDHRSDRPQIILAVATDAQGQPIHLEVLRGNRTDMTTLRGLIKTLQRRFGIKRATFVFDGGMSSHVNLEEMTLENLHYVTRLSNSTFKSLFDKLSPEHQLELGDRDKLLDVTHEGKRYVIAGGVWRQQRDQERREARIKKGEAELKRISLVKRKEPATTKSIQKLVSQVGRVLQRLKAHKYFDYQVTEKGQLKWELKKGLVEEEKNLDGWYLLHTNHKPEERIGDQILSDYKGLLDVEEAFCELKSYLEVRPVFHWKPHRVRNHVRICFIAYWLSARLSREWRAKKENGEVPRILRELQTIRIGKFSINGKETQTRVTQVPKALNKVLENLGLLNLFATPPDWAKT
jgi:transposase